MFGGFFVVVAVVCFKLKLQALTFLMVNLIWPDGLCSS